jgi:hypothetical protein
MRAVPNTAAFCSSLISRFPGIMRRYCVTDIEIVPVAPIITGITSAFTFRTRWISITRSSYFRILYYYYYYYYYWVVMVVAQECYYIQLVSESGKFHDNDEYYGLQLPLRHSSSHSEYPFSAHHSTWKLATFLTGRWTDCISANRFNCAVVNIEEQRNRLQNGRYMSLF